MSSSIPSYVADAVESWAGEPSPIPCQLWTGSSVQKVVLPAGTIIRCPQHDRLGFGLLVGSSDAGEWLQVQVPAHAEQSGQKQKRVKAGIYSVQGSYSVAPLVEFAAQVLL